MKRKKSAILAVLMALVIVLSPTAVFAAEDYEAGAQEVQEVAVAGDNPFQWVTDALADTFGEVRQITLTPEAMEMALYDFDYLVAKILGVAPTQNIIERRIGTTAEEFFARWREIITQNFPVPSVASFEMPDLWGEAREGDLYAAADYLFTVLFVAGLELGGIGHMSAQGPFLIEQAFLMFAQMIYTDFAYATTQEEIDAMLALGFTYEQLYAFYEAAVNSVHHRYQIFNTPSVLWFYGFDPSEFDLYADLNEFLGILDPDNITTAIIEEGRTAYLRIASFLGNLDFDSQTLFPFFEKIQDYEHLIIDIRGNLGGWAHYFNTNIVARLIDEPIFFEGYEFFIASEKTANLFENPFGTLGGVVYGIFPAAEFVQERNMHQFNQEDLALLDYVIVWQVGVAPAENNTPFGGEIWLLVDGSSASASDNAATFSIATGFAAVVGEPTRGITGVIYDYALLPNTGILFRIDLGYTVDQYGRSLEEFGVIPQIPNLLGWDALETVLTRIGFEKPTEPDQPVAPEGFVSLRLAAYAHGYAVEWDGSNNSVLVISEDGSVRVVPVSEEGTFNDNGTVFVTIEYAAALFTAGE